MKTLTLIAAAAFAVTSVAAAAIPLPAGTYVKKAGASDMFEIESSKLMLDSRNPKIVDFANKMIADHTKSTDEVVAAAKADGMTPGSPTLTPKQTSMLNELKRTSGKNRDTVYEQQQLAGHKMAAAFTKEYAMSGDKPHLKSAAGAILPVIEGHLSMMASIAPAGVKAP